MSLKIANVTKKYKDFTAVNDISINLEQGNMLGFLGRNGAGKTTTFRMILGLTPITEGQILYKIKQSTNQYMIKLDICLKNEDYIQK